MESELGGTEPEPVLGRMVAVEDYILCGFLPPPSEFILPVLNFYGLSLLHLNPNSIAFLSIFSYLCEAYIGVESFLDLFRFYYELRWMEPKKVSGCLGFRLRDGLKSRYIPFQCPSSRSKWRARWFYLQIENSDPASVVPEEQPDKILEWTAKPALTPSLQSLIDIIDDLRVRGLSGYEVAADFIGLNSETVERRVGQALPLMDVIGPLADHQAAASLKEGVAKEVSDIASAATTSGSNVPKKGRMFSSVLGNRRKAPTPSATDASSPPQRRQRLVTLSEKAARARGCARRVQCSLHCIPCSGLDGCRGRGQGAGGARGVGREIEEARVAASSANERANKLARDLAERQGLEHRMSELENNLSEIRGSLRMTYTGLHQLAGECGVTSTIPANPDEFSLTSSLTELATAMEEIPCKHAARIGEEMFNGIYTGACHVLACMRLAHPNIDLQRILDQGGANDVRKGMMDEFGDLGDVDIEVVQQRGQLELPVVVPALVLEPYVPRDDVDQSLSVEVDMVMTSLDLESVLADRDHRIQYWRMKFKVAELERTMVEVKKEQAVEALRGREVWFNSYLRSCCMAMAGVCRELRVPRGNPEESAAGYISWLNGACAQLEVIGKHIDEALKQECRRLSRYAGGHVLACVRDHRPQLHLEFLQEGFSRSRRTPAEIDNLAKSMAPLAEKVFQSMDWR
uniref:Retrotransposon protein, putative, unclassified n=2 Tax=Oryza sativa subsp. japonica TaxID=39947 RepID=Q53KM6_ORYSJ|nr:retrotransposon protein, putative, unclassified [Oryza sativa Japonica Group]AAX94985.1 retrotransposon protein, putative, unclassified [Oryza sativa Japonica Group]ABA93345.1 retrotransposon protein, putative, unclassified [Oryza sativa Japonica Group]